MFAPLGTPEPIIKRLNDALIKAMDTPEARKQFEEIGIEVVLSNPSDLSSELKQQADFWGPLIERSRREAGLIARRSPRAGRPPLRTCFKTRDRP